MKAMLLEELGLVQTGSTPLRWTELSEPTLGDEEVLLHVQTCGVCHTELDEIEGRAPPPRLPVILGHQIIGRVVAVGSRVVTPPRATVLEWRGFVRHAASASIVSRPTKTCVTNSKLPAATATGAMPNI